MMQCTKCLKMQPDIQFVGLFDGAAHNYCRCAVNQNIFGNPDPSYWQGPHIQPQTKPLPRIYDDPV